MTQYVPKFCRPKRSLLSRAAGPVCLVLSLVLLLALLPLLGTAQRSTVTNAVPDLSEQYQSFLSKQGSFLPDAAPTEPVPQIVKLNDSDLVAPKPLAEGYGQITLVDLRYLPSALLGEYLDFHGQDVLFLYSSLLLNNSLSLR